MNAATIDLEARGPTAETAAERRSRLTAKATDWGSSEMAAYDHYDAANADT